MSFVSYEGRTRPSVFSDIPSRSVLAEQHAQIQELRERMGRRNMLFLVLLGVNIAIAVAALAFYRVATPEALRFATEVSNRSVIGLYSAAIGTTTELLTPSNERLGIAIVNLYFLSAYLAFSHVIQLLRTDARLFSDSVNIAAELRETAKAITFPVNVPIIFLFAIFAAPFVSFSARAKAMNANRKKTRKVEEELDALKQLEAEAPEPKKSEELLEYEKVDLEARLIREQAVALNSIAIAPFLTGPVVLLLSSIPVFIMGMLWFAVTNSVPS